MIVCLLIDWLIDFSDFYANLPTTLPQKNEEGPADDGKLKSEIMIKVFYPYYPPPFGLT